MEFVGAFLVCGCICLCTQLVSELLPKVPGPTLFLLVQTVAALLVPTGVVAALTNLGQAGIVITVFAAGSTICQDVGIIMGGGSAVPLITIVAIFCAVAAIGLAAGAAHRALRPVSADGQAAEGDEDNL